jgi:soluble lytic murein transglycosylase-like protein
VIDRTVIAALAGVAVLYLMKQGQGAGTAGDEDSNFLLDGIEDMSSILNDWPIGSGPYQAAIIDAANTYGVPERILAWLLWKECRYTSAIITGAKRSPRGAMGIAQFMPATAKQELGSAEAALDPAVAIPGAARYLAKLARSTSNWAEALAAYNWGIGNVQRKGIGAAPAETVDYYTTILAKAGGDYA